ncbi:hypothetical protein Hdeb2414_s0016g00474281 [Helianthus debilis subsp. tardiflorus]
MSSSQSSTFFDACHRSPTTASHHIAGSDYFTTSTSPLPAPPWIALPLTSANRRLPLRRTPAALLHRLLRCSLSPAPISNSISRLVYHDSFKVCTQFHFVNLWCVESFIHLGLQKKVVTNRFQW